MQQIESKLVADYYSQHYEELCAFVAVRLQYAPETEDVVQTVFLKLLLAEGMITPVTLPSLVYTVARNLICDYWRHRGYVHEFEHYLCSAESQLGGIYDAESVYSAIELDEILQKGIARLPEKQSSVYRLNLLESMPVREIALRLDLKYKNAENRLGLARKEVRNYVRRMLA